MAQTITFKGSPLTLVGRALRVGVAAPDFTVVNQDLKPVTLGDFAGKAKVITFFPSIDTPVCDLQVKEFNKKAAGLSEEVAIAGISKDLPFAQKRFCSDNNIKSISILSDYATSSFGINYGVLIKELNLLGRGVVILDKNNVVRYIQIVKELTAPPDYKDALAGLEEVLKNPEASTIGAPAQKCTACEGKVAPLAKEKIAALLAKFRGWELIEDKKLAKEFKFKDFAEAKYFVDLVSVIAQEQGHHPVQVLSYGKVKISLSTHAAGGLTDNDFIMARIIDEIGV